MNKDTERFVRICEAISGVKPDWYVGPRIKTVNQLRGKGMRKKDAILICAIGACFQREILNDEKLEKFLMEGEI